MKKILFHLKCFVSDNFSIVRGKGNVFAISGIFYNVKRDIRGNNNSIFLGEKAILKKSKIFIRGSNNQIIIQPGAYLQHLDLWIENDNNTIRIGRGTTIESGHLAVTEDNKNIKIGDGCMFSTNVTVRTGDSHSIIEMESGIRINYAKDVEIGNEVWIGANSTVLKGSIIGSNSIIGTGSVVSGIFGSNCIVAGVPAKIIKENVSWKRERI